jgi:hypothetical protein
LKSHKMGYNPITNLSNLVRTWTSLKLTN